MNYTNKPFYIVSSGCNSRHLLDVEVFDLLRDARARYESCSAPAKVLTRHVELCRYPTPDQVEVTKLYEQIN